MAMLFANSKRICSFIADIKNPNKTSFTSLTTSRFAVAITALTSLISAFFNILVIFAIYKNSTFRKKKAHVLLTALVFSDVIGSVVEAPLFITKEVLYQKGLEPSCLLILLWVYSALLAISELLLAAITGECFISVRFPIWHRAHVTKSHLTKIAGICFIVGIGIVFARCITEKAKIPMFALYLGSVILTTIFAVLIWWTISKKRCQQLRTPNKVANEKQRPCPINLPMKEFDLSKDSHLKKNCAEEPLAGASNSEHDKKDSKHEIRQSSLQLRSDHERRDLQQNGRHANEAENGAHHDDILPRRDKTQINWFCTTQKQCYARISRLTISERKSAMLAVYLAISLVVTRVIPVVLFICSLSGFIEALNIIEPFVGSLVCLTPLINLILLLAKNIPLRKACWKLLTKTRNESQVN